MSKTIKQIANEIGVSKQAVHQKRKSKELSTALQPFTTTVDGVVYISVDGENLLKQAFEHNDRKQVDGSFTTTVDGLFTQNDADNSVIDVLLKQSDMLKKELECKNEQLSEKDRQIEQLTTALTSAQVAQQQLTTALTTAQALHAGTIQQNMIEDKQENRSFFGRIFNKRNKGVSKNVEEQ